jgi:RNA recognition motif-containing protein
MFPPLADLLTESDVEQKLLWTFLTTSYPVGLALQPPDVVTKLSIKRLEIGKGGSKKLYFPDYIVLIAGLPVLVIEAKAPGEPPEQGLDEARLYGNELNARFPPGMNPCFRVISCNGAQLLSSPIDVADPDIRLQHSDFVPTHPGFAQLVETCGRPALQRHADELRRRLRKGTYHRPLSLIGGQAFQDEELPQNTFGATIAGDYGHIFNPTSRDDRAHVVRHAYVPSLRRQRYVEPIDRVIRNAVTPPAAALRMLEDSSTPTELVDTLRDRRRLENQILLLVGSVGVGKSTFMDYLSFVALPDDLRRHTIWLRLNLNEAPLSTTLAYDWVTTSLIAEIRSLFPDVDFDELPTLQKILAPELTAFRKGPLALLPEESREYQSRLADRIIALQEDKELFAKAMARYVCAGPGRLLVIVLDNCDKRNRDDQLAMFQVAQWVQHQFRSLVVLPIRDVTFELHRHEPPLDTALKHLVFRIEPPNFAEVLQARVRLALEEMRAAVADDTDNTFSYQLPNGMRVTYPSSDQALYLASILRSLFAHDRFVRQIMTGLAGRDVRRALEIFLDFCTSGHIGEDEILKIRFFEGAYVLPLSIVARVLLRMQRRFYDGDKTYIKNLVQCAPSDPLPDHFIRLAVLHWLDYRKDRRGPAGVNGFHRIADLIGDLVRLGHDAIRAREELLYLIRERAVVAEHLRTDSVDDGDLIRITAGGIVHLQLMANSDYLAACAEDTWFSDQATAQRIADRLTGPLKTQFARTTTALTANDLVGYLKTKAADRITEPDAYLVQGTAVELNTLREAEAAIAASEIEVSPRIYVGNLPSDTAEDDIRKTFTKIGLTVKRVVLPRDREKSRNRGYAFVDLLNGREALLAFDAQDRLLIGGRHLRLGEAAVQDEESPATRGRPTSKLTERLYVANLPYSMDESGLRRLFAEDQLRPKDIYLPRDRSTGRSRGYAFVSMDSIDEAARAIGTLDGKIIEGRKTTVKPADPARTAVKTKTGRP